MAIIFANYALRIYKGIQSSAINVEKLLIYRLPKIILILKIRQSNYFLNKLILVIKFNAIFVSNSILKIDYLPMRIYSVTINIACNVLKSTENNFTCVRKVIVTCQ